MGDWEELWLPTFPLPPSGDGQGVCAGDHKVVLELKILCKAELVSKMNRCVKQLTLLLNFGKNGVGNLPKEVRMNGEPRSVTPAQHTTVSALSYQPGKYLQSHL